MTSEKTDQQYSLSVRNSAGAKVAFSGLGGSLSPQWPDPGVNRPALTSLGQRTLLAAGHPQSHPTRSVKAPWLLSPCRTAYWTPNGHLRQNVEIGLDIQALLTLLRQAFEITALDTTGVVMIPV